MTRPTRHRAPLAAVLALAAAASGCEIIASFDRSLIDAGGTEDAAAYDAEYPDGAPGVDGNTPPAEASVNEGGDSSQTDGGPDGTTDAADAGDANVHDSNVPDTSDANEPDTSDANQPDTSDANLEDADDDGG